MVEVFKKMGDISGESHWKGRGYYYMCIPYIKAFFVQVVYLQFLKFLIYSSAVSNVTSRGFFSSIVLFSLA
jgi:hypothetical protein